jgi:hypothetical protein
MVCALACTVAHAYSIIRHQDEILAGSCLPAVKDRLLIWAQKARSSLSPVF